MKIGKILTKQVIVIFIIINLLSMVFLSVCNEPSNNSNRVIPLRRLRGFRAVENNSTPYLVVDEWVTPRVIYKQESSSLPNTGIVTMTVTGVGDNISQPQGPRNADIAFVVDTTGSMRDTISQVKSDMQDIIDYLEANYSTNQYGLASYTDHPGSYSGCNYSGTYGSAYDWPFRKELDFTPDAQKFKDAVTNISEGNGADGPESVLDAVYHTTHNFSWRGGNVLKIAVLIGDNCPHDCENDYGKWGDYRSTGPCPHKLKAKTVVQDTVNNDVIWVTIGIDYTEDENTTGWAFWNYLAEESKGRYKGLGVEKIANVIIELLGEALKDINIAGADARVTMVLPNYLTLVEGSFKPQFSNFDGARTYEWSLGSVGINETVKIKFEIQSKEVGYDVPVTEYPTTKLNYLAWNGTDFVIPTEEIFPETFIDVIEKITSSSNLPTSAIIQPINNRYYNSLTTISGSAFTNIKNTKIEKVEISLIRLSDYYYWTDAGWTPEANWLLCSGTLIWDFNSTYVTWTSGERYLVQSRAYDNKGNIELPESGVMFNMDLEPPRSTVIYPRAKSYLNKLISITGRSIDPGGAGVDAVEITIRRTTDSYYWDGQWWGLTEAWLPVLGTSSWAYNSSQVLWISDINYTIRARASDKVGNLESPGLGNTFMYDDIPPTQEIVINNDEKYTNKTLVMLSLHGTDSGSGVELMAFSTDELTWTTWEQFTPNKSYHFTSGDGEKSLYLRLQDRAGNIAEPDFDTIILDTMPPEELSIVINNHQEFTNNREVQLSLHAIDRLSGVDTISVYNHAAWSSWVSFQKSKIIILHPQDGEKTIGFSACDHAGNIAEPVFDTIILDTTPPHSLFIIINDGAPVSNLRNVTLLLNALDNHSGVAEMAFSIDDEPWTSWETFINESTLTLTPINGVKTVYFKVKDRVNNTAKPVAAKIILNTTSPPPQPELTEKRAPDKDLTLNVTWIYLIIIVVVIIISIIVTHFLRQKKRGKKSNSD
ncbi:vWA domain-containing protein [[Eubacterium] cellulosolvens]